MNLFADYIQPLTNWIQAHPNGALFITFIISLTESLAIIGSIIPGTITMTAIGMLAGSGVMRVDLTLLAAILGAITGDSLSYLLGFFYSDRLMDIWPFYKYPTWFAYGKSFFSKHGGKSVLLGRFAGPLRSIIPVIAGIMHMKHWRFFIANVLSAIGWSLLYILPGVLIGAASYELSPETTTRLFVMLLGLLISIWLLSSFFKWLFSKLNVIVMMSLQKFWKYLKQNPSSKKLVSLLTPPGERRYFRTASITLATLLTLLGFILILLLNIQSVWIFNLNLPIHLLIQSFRSHALQVFFIACTLFTSPLSIFLTFIFCIFWFYLNHTRKAIFYILSIIISGTLIGYVLSLFIINPRPPGLLVNRPGSSFLALEIELATAFYGFILFYASHYKWPLVKWLKVFIVIILCLSGLGAIYIGDFWFSDVIAAYLLGLTLCLIHCLFYRKSTKQMSLSSSVLPVVLVILILTGSTVLNFCLNIKHLINDHTLYHPKFILTETQWWHQNKPILPTSLTNRLGKKISLLNLQYCGDLGKLSNQLKENGWNEHTEAFLSRLLLRMNSKSTAVKLPVLAQLFDNKLPKLVMTYSDKNLGRTLELRIWESNYYLSETQPIWIGSLQFQKMDAKLFVNQAQPDPFIYLKPLLKKFTIKELLPPKDQINLPYLFNNSRILLIK